MEGIVSLVIGIMVGAATACAIFLRDLRCANDKIDGLETELRQAVLCAYLRGAREWAVLNFPDWREWLEAHDDYAHSEPTTPTDVDPA